MRRLSSVVFVIVAYASPIATPAVAAEDPCGLAGEIASTAMTLRLSGVSFPAARAKLNETLDPIRLPELVEAVLIEAYESPRYTGERARKTAVQEFQNKWYVGCVRSQAGIK